MEDAGPKLTAADEEARRKLAIRDVLSGRTRADAADFLGVHPVTVAEGMGARRAGGEGAVAAEPIPGRPRPPTDAQEAEARARLLQKPADSGFRTDPGTAARVAQVIRGELGAASHPSYLREWLSKRGYSPPKPVRRAKRRNPQAIDARLGRGYPPVREKWPAGTPTSCRSTGRGCFSTRGSVAVGRPPATRR